METLKKFDYFPKLSETVEVRKTSKGGLIFAIFSGIMLVLCLIELYTLFLGDPIIVPVIEKPDITEKVRINLNISLYDTPCQALSLDLQDITGSHFEDLQQTIYKLELDERGYIIDRSKFEVVQKLENKNFFPSHPIWERFTKSSSTSCYGAELFIGQECKTCQEVMSAYMQRGWPVPQPNPFVQCKGMKMGPRVLSEEIGVNVTENLYTVENLFIEETRPQFYLANTLFEVGYVKQGEVFSFELMRKKCQYPQNAFLEFSYLDYETNTTKQAVTTPIFFRATECKSSIPVRIESFKDQELVLEVPFLEDKIISININDGDLFSVKVLGETPNTQVDGPSAVFKAGSGNVVRGRMLHAEFYGYDDVAPTMVSQQEVDFFKTKMGTGCQIVGTMFINKVPGNFHISTHHKGQALFFLENELTARHKIHLLEFTREDDRITLGKYTKATNPLDGRELKPQFGQDVQYFLKIVGSSYTHPIWGETKYYEFVAHEDLTQSRRKNMILLEFKLEFDPISMKYKGGRESLTGFLVSLLAIIGGIFATSTYIDRLFNKD